MKEIKEKYILWKMENPDEDYQYDEIHEFVADLSRCELQSVFEYIAENVE